MLLLQVQICRLQDFDAEFKSSFKQGSGALYTSAVLEAFKDCWTKLYKSDKTKETRPEGFDGYLQWAENTFQPDISILPQGEGMNSVLFVVLKLFRITL